MPQNWTLGQVARLATARLVTIEAGDPGVIVDLLFGSAGIEAETVQGAAVLEIRPGLRLPVAGDLRALGEVLDATGKREARVAVRLIAARGDGRRHDAS